MKKFNPSLSVSLLILNLLGGIGVASAVPIVTWIRPPNGTNFPAGFNILMTARATNSFGGGPVSFVEFYANSNLLATVISNSAGGTYNFFWSNAPAGVYQLHAEGVDTNGARGISGSVQITVVGTNQPPSEVIVPCAAGYTTIGSNFRDPLPASSVIANPQDGMQLYHWNSAAEAYNDPYQYISGFGWFSPSDPNEPIFRNGEGWWLGTDVPTQARFSGVPGTIQAKPRPANGFYFLSDQTPQPSRFQEVTGFAPQAGDRVYKYDVTVPTLPANPAASPSSTHVYNGSSWDVEPILDPGKAMWVELGGPPPTNAVPVVTWLEPPNGSSFRAGSPILLRAQATDSDGTVSFVDFFAVPTNGPQMFVGRSTFGGTNGTYTGIWSNAPAGEFQLHAEAQDNQGGRGISGSVGIVVTNQPPNVVPVVTWLEPPDGSSFLAGSPIVLRAQASDSDGTVSFVDFFAAPTNGPQMFVGRSTFGGTNGTYTVIWSNAPAGQFQLHAEAQDNRGGRGVSGSVGIVVTNQPPNVLPVVTWLEPPDGSGFPGGGSPIVLRASATDSDGTVSFVDFFAVPTNGPQIFVGRSTFGSTNGTYTVIWSNTPAGQFQLHAEAQDNRGGRGISGSVGIVVSNPPPNALPVVTWVQPANGSTVGGNISLRARATDSDGTISFVEFFATPTNGPTMNLGLGTRASSDGLYIRGWTNPPAGQYELHAEAVDNAGGRGISGSVTVNVGEAPIITSHPQSQTVTAGATVTFSVTATGSAPLSYRWRKAAVFIPGANSSTLTLSNVTSTNAGVYSVVVTNLFGSRLSSNATLTVVAPSNSPPVVTLISPTNGAVFLFRQPIVLRALASDSDGTVSFVDFFANTTLVARASASGTNFMSIWSNAPAGSYDIRAIATDNSGAQAVSDTASITVLSNRPPTAFDQAVSGQQDSSVAITLQGSDPDGDFLTFVVLTSPAHGTVSGSPPSLTYTPHPNYFGSDSFTFAARDQEFESAPATVQITVTRVNHGPIAQIDIPNALTFLGAPTVIAVTGDFESNATATVILDASQSFDPDGDPLTYLWSVGNVPFDSGVRVTNEIPPGDYLFQLTVSDGELSGTNFAQLAVLTPCDAIGLLIIRIDESALDRADKRPLIKVLETSCTVFVEGDVAGGIENLEAFQHKVAIRIGASNPAFAEFLINEAQTLIDAVSGP